MDMNLVNALDGLLDNKDEAENFAEKAGMRFLKNYELRVFEQKIKRQYNQLE